MTNPFYSQQVRFGHLSFTLDILGGQYYLWTPLSTENFGSTYSTRTLLQHSVHGSLRINHPYTWSSHWVCLFVCKGIRSVCTNVPIRPFERDRINDPTCLNLPHTITVLMISWRSHPYSQDNTRLVVPNQGVTKFTPTPGCRVSSERWNNLCILGSGVGSGWWHGIRRQLGVS